ncbi:serine/threonine-protein kinase [Agromyces larvae]|uniref:non-specific serine/threonine protein kinase n=1 Tax=Agromyces larvae TaxID=2929802 RepID=A0ABY4C3K1_9MICO|nr:serine/threonine-protein kinase [Agromyces larvae]UOE44621.1 serine/threonine protein kinase [Agromyces larvae]
MNRRLPSTPPTLPGFVFVRALGSGGFADVFCYEQDMPRRVVAVKVLLAELVNDEVRRMFRAEADLMAQLSSHPSILTVYQAGVAADGRPYLVMEYCSSTLAERYRSAPLPISEVLAIGVRISSAVEAAHRQGVLHRDIKPSNILTTAYGHPVLGDFGIAASVVEGEHGAAGVSIPWSAPEVLADDRASVASEVWSLGATVYSLLAGRSPFEVPGGANGSAALIARIEKARLNPTGRADVPERLEQVLARAMSRRPAERQASALELLRDLQAVEEELGLSQTPGDLEVQEWASAPLADPVDPVDRTRLAPAAEPGEAGGRRAESRGARRWVSDGPADASIGVPAPPSRRRLGWGVAAALAMLVGVIAAGAGFWLALGSDDPIPVVADLRADVDGTIVTFAWDDPGIDEREAFLVRVEGQDTPARRETALDVPARAGERLCATVRVTRDGRSGAPSAERCVEVEESGG